MRATETATRALVIAGVPLREPVARYGPFVMNTHEEIVKAFNDYQSGRFGNIARSD
jgi:redox-sensitive bicupin YhaK (pirin superfamily)